MRIIQNGYNYADSSQNYHEFLICTHKYHPFRKTSESGWNHPPSCLGKYIIVNVRMCTKLCMLRTKFVATNCNVALIFGSIFNLGILGIAVLDRPTLPIGPRESSLQGFSPFGANTIQYCQKFSSFIISSCFFISSVISMSVRA